MQHFEKLAPSGGAIWCQLVCSQSCHAGVMQASASRCVVHVCNPFSIGFLPSLARLQLSHLRHCSWFGGVCAGLCKRLRGRLHILDTSKPCKKSWLLMHANSFGWEPFARPLEAASALFLGWKQSILMSSLGWRLCCVTSCPNKQCTAMHIHVGCMCELCGSQLLRLRHCMQIPHVVV